MTARGGALRSARASRAATPTDRHLPDILRPGVCRAHAGQWAYLKGGDRLLTPRQANGQRRHRGVQQPPASGVSERFVVPVHGRCPGPDRARKDRRQQGQTPLGPRDLDPKGLRHPSSPSPKSCEKPGPELGCSPHGPELISDPEPPLGANQDEARVVRERFESLYEALRPLEGQALEQTAGHFWRKPKVAVFLSVSDRASRAIVAVGLGNGLGSA